MYWLTDTVIPYMLAKIIGIVMHERRGKKKQKIRRMEEYEKYSRKNKRDNEQTRR